MNSIKKSMVCMTAGVAVAVASAAPVVNNVSMTQASGGRLVTIKYSLSEDAVVTLDVMTNATPNAATGWTSIGGEAVCNAQGAVWRKVTGADADVEGKYTITWRPDLSWTGEQGKGFKVPDGCAKAVVTAWSINNTTNYMVVDITATAKPNTQRYYPAEDFLPGGLLGCPDYRQTTLVMRKIMAKDVTWTMGSVSEGGDTTKEKPHQVSLANNYYIGVFEVTQTQWQQITGYNPSNFKYNGSMRPVERVCYRDIRQGQGSENNYADESGGLYPADPYADSFLGKLRTKTAIDFDLPSEAQWEFAARAGHGDGCWGDGSPISISSNIDTKLNLLGRYLNNPTTNSSTAPNASIDPSAGATAIVGSYAPNSWGLYDMHGNVSELSLDYYTPDITSLNGDVNTTPTGIGNRIKRGGNWSVRAEDCRPAFRDGQYPPQRQNTVGFRVACTAGLE